MNEQEEFEFRARAERESGQKQMGGKPPLGMVLDQVSKMAPWNRASQGLRDIAGAGAEKLGGMGVNPKVAAGAMLPVAMFPDILSAATSLPEKGPPSATLQNLANKARASGSSRWFKAAGGTLSNAKELGADEALRLGRFAREGKYITPFNSSEKQGIAIGKGLQSSGKRLEELRGLGDLYGQSPEASKIAQAIHQDLAPKYSSGIRSGESGELKKAIEEVMKLEPVDKLTASEELQGNLRGATRLGDKTSDPMNVYHHAPGSSLPQDQYEKFRTLQEDPNYIPEYDFRRPTTFNEVSKVSTDINKYAKGQSKLLQPSGAATDVANLVSKMNDAALLKALPQEKGLEYSKNLGQFSDLSKLDRINEVKSSAEVGSSRNSIVNNISNRIFHRFGHQLSAEAMDKISSIIKAASNAPGVNPASIVGIPKLLKRFRDANTYPQ